MIADVLLWLVQPRTACTTERALIHLIGYAEPRQCSLGYLRWMIKNLIICDVWQGLQKQVKRRYNTEEFGGVLVSEAEP